MKVAKLICRSCGRDLEGTPSDVAFACVSCHLVFPFGFWTASLSGETAPDPDSPVGKAMTSFRGTGEYPLGLYRTEEVVGPGHPWTFLLPFWCFHVTPSFESQEATRGRKLAEWAREFHLPVPAFSYHGFQFTGFPGRDWDITQSPVLADSCPDVRGMARDPFAAFVLAWQLILQRASVIADLSGVEMELEHLGTSLLAFPAREEQGRIFFPFGKTGYPTCFFDDLSSIRRH